MTSVVEMRLEKKVVTLIISIAVDCRIITNYKRIYLPGDVCVPSVLYIAGIPTIIIIILYNIRANWPR